MRKGSAKNTISYPYNNGLAEEPNNILKVLKGGTYGRASNRLIGIYMVLSLTG
jgi:transposase